MTSMKTLAFAIGIAFAASSFAVAQQGSPQNPQGSPPNQQSSPSNQQSSPSNNAAASSGGAHQTTARTGTAANRQQIQHRRMAARRAARRRIYAYQMSPRCRQLLRLGRPLPRSCRI